MPDKTIFIYFIGSLLTIIGALIMIILNRIHTDLKETIKELKENSQDIAIIKVELDNKCDKLSCPALNNRNSNARGMFV